MEERLIIAVAGFPICYEMSLFAFRDINKKMMRGPRCLRLLVFPSELLMCINIIGIII